MAQQVLEITFSTGETMIADFLPDKAPGTCKAVCGHLPLTQILSHVKWSGHVISVLTDIVYKTAECSRSFGVVPGDILYNPHISDCPEHPYEIGFVYGPAAMRNVAGFAPHNLFARIRPEYLPALYALGIDVNRTGQKQVTLRCVEA